jgi:phosphoribosylanthranilate isomerase
MSSPRLKVCGITQLTDAQAALNAGADWLGLIFVPGSPRSLSLPAAKTLAQALRESHPQAHLVGVFQDAKPAEIEPYVQALSLNTLQLHGSENPQDYAALGLPMMKVLQLRPDMPMAELQRQAAHYLSQPQVQALLLDLPKGSGLRSILDWPHFDRLPELTQDVPCMVAGGLNPDNIDTVLQALAPWGVDVASGIEKAPGRKDLNRLQTFCQRVKPPSIESPY